MRTVNDIKNITIEYYNVVSFVNVEQEKNSSMRDKCDIAELLEQLQSLDAKKRKIDYYGENIILSNVAYNKNSELWELVFFKSRSATIPYIVNSYGTSRQIVLENDEMISELLCVLYNPKTKVLAMQRNVFAFGSKGMEKFLSSFVNKTLLLDSIQTLSEEKRRLFKKSKIKKFKLHVKNVAANKSNNTSVKINSYNKNTSICRAIDAALAVDSSIINIEFSMGNTSKAMNIEDEDFDIFEDLMNNANVKCLELGLAPDEHSTMQITDFMDFRIHDNISVSFIKGQPIDISEILEKMTEKFKNNIYL